MSRDADGAEAVALEDVAPCGARGCWIPSPETLTTLAEEAALNVQNFVDCCHYAGAPDGPTSSTMIQRGLAELAKSVIAVLVGLAAWKAAIVIDAVAVVV